MRLRRLLGRSADDVLDEALVVAFPEGASATGERCAELHLHGGPAVVRDVLARLTEVDGLRMARPGEFSRRALEGGRLDLVQLESLADLIEAETSAQRRQAIRLASGALTDVATQWRSSLIGTMALFEAVIDFADDVPDEVEGAAREQVAAVVAAMDAALAAAKGAALVRDGFEVSLIGPPNAGKSSILNRIAGREVALTDALPGTTRDVIEVRCTLGGRLVTFVDTAGRRESEDRVERAGVMWGLRRAASSDMRVAVASWDAPEIVESDLCVWNKVDVAPAPGGFTGVPVSAVSGHGVDRLLAEIESRLDGLVGESGLLAQARHVAAVGEARSHLVAAISEKAEFAAEELRLAVRALDMLLGRVDVEAVLDEVFGRFCLGK